MSQLTLFEQALSQYQSRSLPQKDTSSDTEQSDNRRDSANSQYSEDDDDVLGRKFFSTREKYEDGEEEGHELESDTDLDPTHSVIGIKRLSIKETRGDDYIMDVCSHIDIIDENGIVTCLECGKEIERKIMHEQEWRNYGATDGKKTADPTRVQQRRVEEKSIYKDVENLNFSDIVIDKADEIYKQVTNGQIYRKGSRRAIIFACIFHAYKIIGNPQSHSHLIKLLGLNRRTGLKGIKFVNINAPKDSEIHTTVVTPVVLVKDLMNKFKAQQSQIREVTEIYKLVENRSSKLNRARPQSVSAGLVYYWIRKKKMNITIKEFAKIAELSVLTIDKIAKEISCILNTPEILS